MSNRKYSPVMIEQEIEEYNRTGRDFIEDIRELQWTRNPKEFIVGSLGKINLVDAKWPAEGEGEYIWFVFKFDNDELWRIEGYYSSWEGAEWDINSIEPVKPREVINIVYDKDKD